MTTRVCWCFLVAMSKILLLNLCYGLQLFCNEFCKASDAKVQFQTDARTENQKNQTVGSGSVQFGPHILG